MKANSLFTLQSIVAIVLCTSVAAFAEDKKSDEAKPAAESKSITDNSSAQVKAMEDCKADPNGAACKADLQILGVASGSTSQDKCTQAQSALATNFQNSISQQQSLLQAQKEQAQQTIELNNTILEAKNAANDAGLEYQVAVNKINTELANATASAQSATKKALLDLQSKISDLAGDLTAANDALRASVSAISKAQTKREATCRASADRAGQEKKKEIDTNANAVKSATASGKSALNISQTAASGYSNRVKAKRLADIQAEYMNEYKNCLAGSNTAGAAAAEEITDAQSDYNDAQAHYKEVLAQIADKKALLNAAVAQADADGKTQVATIAANAQTELAQAAATYQSKVNAANTKMTESVNAADVMKPLNQQSANLAAYAASFSAKQLSQAQLGVMTCAGDIPKSPVAAAAATATTSGPTSRSTSGAQ